MTRRQLAAGVAGAGALRAARRKPNVILILADDLGFGDLGCYGSKTNRTPHLDRLAADGLRFTNHYSPSPVCSPARAGLLTGLAPDHTGVTGVLREEHDAAGGLSLQSPTMADHFRRRGYRTALIGKWHLGMSEPFRPMRRGFDSFWGFLNGVIDYNTHVSTGGGWRGRRTTFEGAEPAVWAGYFPDLLAGQAVRFIESNRAEPYFLYVAHPLPHLPLQAPEKWIEPFRGMQPDRAVYAAMVACLDAAVGAIREALERRGQWDRTILLFASDNGWAKQVTPAFAPLGSNGPLRGGKYELYEGGIRAPCLLRWPGVTRPGDVTASPSWLCDWVPTLAGHATADGIDLRDVAAGGSRGRNRALFWRFEDKLVKTPLSYAVRQGKWKLLIVGGQRRLFDLEADESESADVAAANPDIAARLERRLRAWVERLPKPA